MCFDRPVIVETYGYAETEDSHGGRGELRRLRATDLLKAYLDWPGYREVVMVKSKGASIIGCFASLRDRRIERTKRRKLLEMVAIAI